MWRQGIHLHVARDTQTIQSFKWPKWSCFWPIKRLNCLCISGYELMYLITSHSFLHLSYHEMFRKFLPFFWQNIILNALTNTVYRPAFCPLNRHFNFISNALPHESMISQFVDVTCSADRGSTEAWYVSVWTLPAVQTGAVQRHDTSVWGRYLQCRQGQYSGISMFTSLLALSCKKTPCSVMNEQKNQCTKKLRNLFVIGINQLLDLTNTDYITTQQSVL